MTTLRQAAQQALEVEADRRRKALAAEMRAALAKQAEPVEQMPVGWLESPHGAFRADPLYKMQFPSQLLQWQIALYTAPPQRKPLTEEEIIDATEHIDTSRNGYFIHIARAIERAHGIGKQAEPVQEPITRLFGTLPVHDAQQDEPVCRDCYGVGYDASGQLCGCQP